MQIEVIIEKKSHKLDAEEGKTILETLQEHGIHEKMQLSIKSLEVL